MQKNFCTSYAADMTTRRIAALSLLTAPLLILVGWAVMRLGGSGGREPGWTIAHIAWVLDNVMLAIVCGELYRRTPATGRALARFSLARLSLALGLAGSVALIAQMTIDLVVGFATANRTDMRALSATIHDFPGVQLAVYDVGPSLLFLGLIALTVQLAVARRIPARVAVLVTAATLTAGVELVAELPLRLMQASAATLLWLALAPLGWQLLRGDATGGINPGRPAKIHQPAR